MPITNYLPSSRLIQPGVCTSSTRPASPFEGMAIFETDTDRMLIWNGTAWVIPNAPAQNPTGLEFVKSTTVTSNTTGIVDDCFSSTYRDYQVIVDVTGGTANLELVMNFRVGGSAAITNYNYSQYGALPNGTASNTTTGGTDTKVALTFIPATQHNSTSYFIGQPNLAVFTFFSGDWLYDDGGTTIARRTIGRHRTATAYTGLQVSTSAAWTGLISVYGYRNS